MRVLETFKGVMKLVQRSGFWVFYIVDLLTPTICAAGVFMPREGAHGVHKRKRERERERDLDTAFSQFAMTTLWSTSRHSICVLGFPVRMLVKNGCLSPAPHN